MYNDLSFAGNSGSSHLELFCLHSPSIFCSKTWRKISLYHLRGIPLRSCYLWSWRAEFWHEFRLWIPLLTWATHGTPSLPWAFLRQRHISQAERVRNKHWWQHTKSCPIKSLSNTSMCRVLASLFVKSIPSNIIFSFQTLNKNSH
jgi:hypothetical protein